MIGDRSGRRLRRTCALVAAGGLLAAAGCGGDDAGERTTTTAPASTDTTVRPTTTSQLASASYTVQRGDTLSAIAARFGTTVDAIVTANGITDPDALQVGQVLEIPARP